MSRSKGLFGTDDPGLVNFYRTSGVRGDFDHFEPSLARQEFAEECDINKLMEKYEKSGAFSHVNRAVPVYMDCTQFPDLRGAMDVMREASVAFSSLSAKVRREFDNDPQKFVDYCNSGDPEALKKLREWGLAEPEPVPPAPTRVEVVNPALPVSPAGEAVKPSVAVK